MLKRTSQTLDQSTRELLFLISPPRHIASDVSVLKDDIHYLTGKPLMDRHARGHIALFRYQDEHLLDMVKHVEKISSQFKPFNIFLKDFGVMFNGSKRSIYLDIVNKYPIQEMFEKLVKSDPDFLPHIPIARNLEIEDFLRCWPYLKGLHYGNQHFLCDRITVLARGGGKWTHYKEILFD